MQIGAFLVLQILGVLCLCQSLLILWRPKRAENWIHEVVSLVGLLAAFLASLGTIDAPVEFIFGGLLASNKIFRLMISALLLSALVVNRKLAFTNNLPRNRKPECFLFLSMACLWAFTLWYSTELLTSYLCLLGLAVTGLFATGLAFSDATEGEAALKYWYQTVIALLFILISLLVVAVVAGDFSFKALAGIFSDPSRWRGLGIFMLLVLPYLLIGGIFPFHFVAVDRDHGAPWAVQALNTLIISGAVYGGLLKLGVELFGSTTRNVSFALNFLVALGFVGTLWGLLGALTQENSKRKLSLFSIGVFSFPLMIVGAPTGTTVGVAIFRFVFSLLALSPLYWVLGLFHERVRNDDSAAAAGMGRQNLGAGLLLLAGLSFFLMTPPIAGFSTTFALVGAAFNEGSLIVLAGVILVSALAGLIAFRLLALVFFNRPAQSISIVDSSSLLGTVSNRVIGSGVFAALVVGGVSWGGIWRHLVDAATALIQLY
jgi:multicomponent Na+:H+ antiporter subunit D